MYKPDHVIVRKIKEYDPLLFVEWNNEKQYFEVWREMPHGRRLITPITQSIYDNTKPISFVQLDERILWWIYDADSWAHGGPRKHALEMDERWKDFQIKKATQRVSNMRDASKDCYNLASSFYATKHKSKNSGIPKLNKPRRNTWVRPDVQARTSSRLFSRSTGNALAYDWKK